MTMTAQTSPKSPRALPYAAPALMRREIAASYLSISANYFDRLVRDGVIPPAKRLGGVKGWLRDTLEAFAANLPDDGPEDAGKPDSTWE